MKPENMHLSALEWCDLDRGPLIHVPPAAPVAMVRHLTALRSRQVGEMKCEPSPGAQPLTVPTSDPGAKPSIDSSPTNSTAGSDTQSTITDWYSPEQLVRMLDSVERLRSRLLTGRQTEVKRDPRRSRKGGWTLTGRAGRGKAAQGTAATRSEVAATAGRIAASATGLDADQPGSVPPVR
jgi:hypothetical protein